MNQPPPLPKSEQPTVVLLFRVFCFSFAAFLIFGNAMSLIAGPKLGLLGEVLSADDPTLRERLLEEERNKNYMMMAVSAIAIPMLLIGGFVPARPWGFVYGLVVLSGASLFCISLIFTIPLFVFWIKPHSNRYFNGT